ncbi:DMT family transporter [Rummeliibacillus suwonensis]|uniref:DMT family transporter n=1 Tax=Rummeliibacillus suwonensis TaxID=1306154 RepID=UPI00289DBE75|nr:DMT family transporter [Rummeliibacillus suwonensis]
MNKFPPVVLLLIATILWGGNFVIGKAVANDLPPFTLAFFRWCVALIIFLPIIYTSLKREWPQIKKHWAIILALGFTGIAGFNTLIYISLHYTTSINASLMNMLTPVIIYMLSFLFLHERLNRNQIIGTAISFIGVITIISNGSLEVLRHFRFNKGDLIVIIALVLWSVYSLLVKQYAKELPGHSTFFVSIAVGIVMLLPFYIYETLTTTMVVHWSATSIFAILYTGILASIVAFIAWNTGVVKLGTNRAGIYLNLIPVFASIFAVIFIGEKIVLSQVVGGLLVLMGVYWTGRKIAEKKQIK